MCMYVYINIYMLCVCVYIYIYIYIYIYAHTYIHDDVPEDLLNFPEMLPLLWSGGFQKTTF